MRGDCFNRYCRLCFESDEVISPLISPCKCKGSSLLIHRHCLELWQDVSFENNNPLKAITCQVCNSRYSYPSWVCLIQKLFKYVIWYYISSSLRVIRKSLFGLAIEPLKLFIHAILVFVTLPWGQFNLGDITLSWIGNEFPPQLALVSTGEPVADMTDGVILVASPTIPKSSIFHNAVVLLIEYSVDHGARGVILNCDVDTTYTPISYVNTERIGYGGPIDKNTVTVIHDCRDLSNDSDFSCLSENIFITEYDSARRTLSQLSHKAKAIIKLYRVAAQKAKRKLQECRTAATHYANRAKATIATSLRSAFTSTRRVVSRVSQGDVRLLQLLRRAVEFGRLTTLRTETPLQRYCDVCQDRLSADESSSPLRDVIRFRYLCILCRRRMESASPTRRIGGAVFGEMYRYSVELLHQDSDDSPTDEDNEPVPLKTSILVVRGYVKWTACQLDGEIRRNLWHVLPLRHQYVFPEKRDQWSWWSTLRNISLANKPVSTSASDISDSMNCANSELSEGMNNFFNEFTLTWNDLLAAISSPK